MEKPSTNQENGNIKPTQLVPEFQITIPQAKERIEMLQKFVREMMKEGIDYGVIPGCPKPSLFKSGAEKLCDIFGFSKQVNVINHVEDWDKGLFHYQIKATLINKQTGLIEAEGIRLAHLGSVKQAKFSQAQLERLDNVDILFLPVGGGDGLSSKQAAEVISALEPRLVVPMNYQIPGLKFKLENLEDFKKEVGGNFETVDKLKISKKDLPEEETRLVVIEPSK